MNTWFWFFTLLGFTDCPNDETLIYFHLSPVNVGSNAISWDDIKRLVEAMEA